MKRLPAFTLLEVILSLFLMALFGIFAFYILQNLQGGTQSLTEKDRSQQELIFFSTALRADLEKADVVREGTDGELICQTNTEEVQYTAGLQGILRTTLTGRSDTFHLPTKQSTMIHYTPNSSLVSLWQLTFVDAEQGTAAFMKTYGPADLVRETTNDGHSITR